MKHKIFISSVQSEFRAERKALKEYIHNDALLNRFFDVFVFEDLPASERHPNRAYIERMGTGTRDMIHDCRMAGLAEPEFSLTDGFVATIYRKPGRALEVVTKQSKSERLSADEGTKSAPSHDFEQVFYPGGFD